MGKVNKNKKKVQAAKVDEEVAKFVQPEVS